MRIKIKLITSYIKCHWIILVLACFSLWAFATIAGWLSERLSPDYCPYEIIQWWIYPVGGLFVLGFVGLIMLIVFGINKLWEILWNIILDDLAEEIKKRIEK